LTDSFTMVIALLRPVNPAEVVDSAVPQLSRRLRRRPLKR